MASSVLQVRVEEGLRTQASSIYADLGIDLQTAVRIFLKRSVMENGLPFEMTLAGKREATVNDTHRVMQSMSESAEKAGIADMTLDEINAEIAAARAERSARKVKE